MMAAPIHPAPETDPLSDEEFAQTEGREDTYWRIAFVLGCVLLLGAVWLS